MPKYKIIKQGCYSEERFNKVGDVVIMDEEMALGGIRGGCLEEFKEVEKKPAKKTKK